jgi:glyceraldehyde 3-phosphate dehydrogenase
MQSKKMKVAINGFGRIGRLTARNLLERFSQQVQIVAVNDLTDTQNLAYLFKYDSVYRQFSPKIEAQNDFINIENHGKIQVFSEKDPKNLPWSELGIDVVIESTGLFLTSESAKLHIDAGAKKVVLSAPAKSKDIPTVVMGVNSEIISQTSSKIISNASCTTNCMAPVMRVLDQIASIQNVFGITVHAYTATQNLQDAPNRKSLRSGRAAAINAIPASTGAAKAVELVLPQLKGKLNLSALRIPVITGSMVYLTSNVQRSVDVDTINQAFVKASEGELKGILSYTQQEIVSGDIVMDSHSCIFDASLTEVQDQMVKIVAWYDNEWGYSSRLSELVVEFGKA